MLTRLPLRLPTMLSSLTRTGPTDGATLTRSSLTARSSPVVPGNENPEIIFTHGQNQGGEDIRVLVMHMLPQVEGHGYNTICMTLKQQDAYYMADGSDVPGKDKEIGRGDGSDRVQGYMDDDVRDQYPYCDIPDGVSLQYANREPRFYASVGYNGAIWNLLNAKTQDDEKKNCQVWYYRGTNDGYRSGGGWPKTGIGVKKYVHPDDIADTDEGSYRRERITYRVDPVIRYAEILLSYAEALNEPYPELRDTLVGWQHYLYHQPRCQ